MQKHKLTQNLSLLTPEEHWRLFYFDSEFIDAIHDYLGIEVIDIELEHSGEGEMLEVKRRMIFQSKVKVPSFLDALLKGSRQLIETSHLLMCKSEMISTIELPLIGNRVSYGGAYTWKAQQGGMVRYWDGYCNVKIPLIASKLERFLANELENNIDRAYRFFADWKK